MSDLNYENLLSVMRALEHLQPVPARVRFKIQPTTMVPKGVAYRLQLPKEMIGGVSDWAHVLYVIHPDSWADLQAQGFTDEDLSIALEGLVESTKKP